MRSICLLGLQVAVEGEEWMVLAIDKYDKAHFESETSFLTVFHYEKVLKTCDIVWLVSSTCNSRRQ